MWVRRPTVGRRLYYQSQTKVRRAHHYATSQVVGSEKHPCAQRVVRRGELGGRCRSDVASPQMLRVRPHGARLRSRQGATLASPRRRRHETRPALRHPPPELPALQACEGGAGAVGGDQFVVHVPVRRPRRLPGATERPDDGEHVDAGRVGDGRRYRATRRCASPPRRSARWADDHRRRRVVVPPAPPVRDRRRRPREPSDCLGARRQGR